MITVLPASTGGPALHLLLQTVLPFISQPCPMSHRPPAARRPLPPSPDGTPRTEAALMVHLDPHIPFIPAFLLNFVLGVLAPYIFNQVRLVAAAVAHLFARIGHPF